MVLSKSLSISPSHVKGGDEIWDKKIAHIRRMNVDTCWIGTRMYAVLGTGWLRAEVNADVFSICDWHLRFYVRYHKRWTLHHTEAMEIALSDQTTAGWYITDVWARGRDTRVISFYSTVHSYCIFLAAMLRESKLYSPPRPRFPPLMETMGICTDITQLWSVNFLIQPP